MCSTLLPSAGTFSICTFANLFFWYCFKYSLMRNTPVPLVHKTAYSSVACLQIKKKNPLLIKVTLNSKFHPLVPTKQKGVWYNPLNQIIGMLLSQDSSIPLPMWTLLQKKKENQAHLSILLTLHSTI